MAKIELMDYNYKVSAYLALKQARDFHKSAEYLYGHDLNKPVMVNIAFACELYMKALLMWERESQEKIRDHKLKDLFGMLDTNVQEELKVCSEIKRWDEFLEDSTNAFSAWRYYYEKDKVMFGHIGGLFSLAEALEKKCSELISLKEVLADG